MIFWFSGTGNSLYTGKRLSAELGDIPLLPMSSGVPAEPVGGEGEKVGFVFPSYYGNLPRAVREFINNLEIKPDTYIFTVVTMGGVGHGSVKALESALKEKDLRLNFGRVVLMSGNYVMSYNPADKDKIKAKQEKIDAKIKKISDDIATERQSVKGFRFTSNNLYKNIELLDAQFKAEDSCIGCGQCEKICPVSNIKIEDGKPVWQHHCEHCAACISWCPKQAIQYGDQTKSRRRYQNPDIEVGELLKV